MKPGDKVYLRSPSGKIDEILYTVLEIDDNSIKVKHPDIGGYFIFSRELVLKVVK